MMSTPPPVITGPTSAAGTAWSPPHNPALPPFSLAAVMGEAWRAFTTRWGVITGTACLTVAISFVGGMVPYIGGFISLFTAPLATSATFVAVRAVRREDVRFEMLFSNLDAPRYWWLVLLSLLQGIVSFVTIIPFVIAGVVLVVAVRPAPWVAVFMLLPLALVWVLTYLYLHARLLLAGPLLLDAPSNSTNCIEAMVRSWKITSGRSWTVLAVYVVGSIIALLSLLALLVGYFVVGLPLYAAMIGATYALLANMLSADICPGCRSNMRGAVSSCCPECGRPRGDGDVGMPLPDPA